MEREHSEGYSLKTRFCWLRHQREGRITHAVSMIHLCTRHLQQSDLRPSRDRFGSDGRGSSVGWVVMQRFFELFGEGVVDL